MRYELSDYEWSVIRPMLPNKPRGIPRVDDRRILTASSGSCAQAHHGAICHTATVPLRLATTASFAGGVLGSGTGSWMR
jgi:transposase